MEIDEKSMGNDGSKGKCGRNRYESGGVKERREERGERRRSGLKASMPRKWSQENADRVSGFLTLCSRMGAI